MPLRSVNWVGYVHSGTTVLRVRQDLVGFNFSMFCNSALQSYVASRTTPETRGFIYTFVFSSFSMGMIFSPTVGGYIAENMGIRSVFWLSFVFYSISTALLFFITPSYPVKRAQTTWLPRIKDFPRQYWACVLMYSLGWFTINLPFSFNTPFLQDVARLDLLTIGLVRFAFGHRGSGSVPLYG